MSFVPFCLVKYMDARFAIVLDERSMRRYGSWGTNVKVLPQPTSHHLATHLSSHDTSVGPAFGAIAPNKVSAISHQGPREDCSTGLPYSSSPMPMHLIGNCNRLYVTAQMLQLWNRQCDR